MNSVKSKIILITICLLAQAFTATALPAIVHSDIQYDTIAGVDPSLLSLDIYQPDGAGDSLLPVVCYLHGGSWRRGDKTNTLYKDDIFIDSGYVFVSINYRLSPTTPDLTDPDAVRYPIHDEDVGRALAWVYNNIDGYGGDPDRMGLMGPSAGGHIAALVSTDEHFIEDNGVPLSIIKCVCPLDVGGLDIPFYLRDEGVWSLVLLTYHNAFGTDSTIWPIASPSNHIETGIGIPCFHLVHQNEANRIATHDLFIDSLEAHYVPWSRYIPDSLTHIEINELIGAYLYLDLSDYYEEESESLTASVMGFFRDCLCYALNIDESDDEAMTPEVYAISAHPNPFNSAVTISLDAPGGAIHELPLRVEIFDLNGRMVGEISVGDGSPVPSANGRGDLAPTGREYVWRPDESVGSGVYLVRAKYDNQEAIKRIVYLK